MAANEPADEGADDLLPIVESMLFAAHESLSAQRIARAIGHLKVERVSAAIDALQRGYDAKRSPLMLVEIAGGWRLVTRPEFAPFLARLFSRAEKERLSSAALETLAIVAYRQPATRAEIEAVRGVQVGPVLKLLQERRLVKMVGRAEVVGRPLQYGTTRKFLDHFGLASLEELPKVFPGRTPPPLPAAEPSPELSAKLSADEAEREGAVEGADAIAPIEGASEAPLVDGGEANDAEAATVDGEANDGDANDGEAEEAAPAADGAAASAAEAAAAAAEAAATQAAAPAEPLAAGGISRAGRGRRR
ncbi:MAG: SMC-Scp complex subunit ScpB [Planctomycetes bacterium]|nr:SMC-Scp complex subunit ScpB [Planctomycetota bacterium]